MTIDMIARLFATLFFITTSSYNAFPNLNASVVTITAPDCGLFPQYPVSQLASRLANVSQATSVCSQQKASISFTWYGATTIPCTTKYYNLTTNPCSSFVTGQMISAAKAISPIADRLVIVSPFLCNDGTYGVATTACNPNDTLCYSAYFDMGIQPLDVGAFMHELGHNWGIPHAGIPFNEYGDPMDPMGGAAGTVCHNAPNMYKLSWATPMVNQDVLTFNVGTKYFWVLPSMSKSSTNLIRIRNSFNASAQAPAIFISYRTKTDQYDTDITFDGNVWVHDSPDVPNGRPSTTTCTFLRAALRLPSDTPLDVYDDWGQYVDQFSYLLSPLVSPRPYLKIRLLSKNSDSAVVEVCRMSSAFEANCTDGVDNDCNGLVDAADPACQGNRPPDFPSAPPSPPPPFPPRPPKPPPPPRPPSPPPRPRLIDLNTPPETAMY